MFISSLTITAVFLACVCFCIARVSATSTTTSTTPSGAETPMLQRGGNHHYHYHDHQQTEESKDGVSGSAGGGHSIKIHNFISTDALYDGEQERRVHYNGVTAKETAVTTVAAANNTRESVKLRQVTDGSHFIQLIYGADNEIRDCEFLRQKKIVQDFLETFRKDIERAKVSINRENDYSEIENETEEDIYSFNNVTFQILDNGVPLPTDLSEWLDFEDLKQRCRENHREMKRLLRHKQHGTSEQKRHANNHLERKKRGIGDMFIAPGTKWCGHKRLANDYVDLGGLSNLDRCCRRHDMCPHSISGFSTKYHLFNYRPFSVSHCHCDRRFRTCLKMAGTGPANLIGKLFFNIVQTKCFVLKPQRSCVKRSWWGKCLKQKYRKQAHLRDNIPY
ncbi:uncharacterized protein LOC111869639 isoform X2 [Cryptotermes secundus]|uniref:uncharacterized protein LOC111869639 isoform X2 n=1 Tax=Cryptotermes secundus TaxID=105785 RepID=UPI001454DF5A|nr:uncharacterized protein LOC111869639 isoform X2 [Cryptotermes secundus]